MSRSGRRTGVLGGTFDPPHRAHIALAEAAREALHLDRVLFVPAGEPWRKEGRRISPVAARLEMVRTATASIPWAEVSTAEVEREGPTYTAETLEALAATGETDEAWWFILGADALADMAFWYQPTRIVSLARLAVANRPGHEGDGLVTEALQAAVPGIADRIDLVPLPLLEVSATEIRQRVREGRPADEMLAPGVRAVIDRLGLYRD